MRDFKENAAVQFNTEDSFSGDCLTVAEVCECLSVSRATVKNWIRLGKLTPDAEGPCFSRAYVDQVLEELRSGESMQLKSRRNKSKATGRLLYKEYVQTQVNQKAVEEILQMDAISTESELRVVLVFFALQLYGQSRGHEYHKEVIRRYLQKLLGEQERLPDENESFRSAEVNPLYASTLQVYPENGYRLLLLDLLECVNSEDVSWEMMESIFDQKLSFVKGEDTLGFLYLSLRDIGSRKRAGAYYTPAKIVRELLDRLQEMEYWNPERDFCDPCCGTGNFLLGLVSRGIALEHLFGQDLDAISVCLTRINLALLGESVDVENLRSRIRCGNTLKELVERTYDVILGNPPWGSRFSVEDAGYYREIYQVAKGKTMEAYDLFLEKSILLLKESGTLAFVLPEAILNVAAHDFVRRFLWEQVSFRFVSYLGDVFSGVNCPSVILGVVKNSPGCVAGCRVSLLGRSYVISQERQWKDGVFAFHVSDEEASCLEAISGISKAVYLRGNARFALGIVTGNNQEFLSEEKKTGDERILRGSDIQPYHIQPSARYIRFAPEKFQQVAPLEYYRADEKLIYRFISASPIFAYDDSGVLTLNSCNILIPEIPGLSIKYILAILNSRVAAFFLQKKFRSVKLLRSHIEQIPIPMVSEEIQEEIVQKVDRILRASEDEEMLLETLEERIYQLYSLTEEQIAIIQKND